MKLYTVGYQGVDVKTYIQALVRAGVGTVIDVRETAWSYKRGFCKGSLSEALLRAGIGYVHLPSAGNPKRNRQTARTTYECLRRYERYLERNPEGLNDLEELLGSLKGEKRSGCITCYEAEADQCHRSILAKALVSRSGGITLVHLRP